jgi:hypothetical protein
LCTQEQRKKCITLARQHFSRLKISLASPEEGVAGVEHVFVDARIYIATERVRNVLKLVPEYAAAKEYRAGSRVRGRNKPVGFRFDLLPRKRSQVYICVLFVPHGSTRILSSKNIYLIYQATHIA